MTQTIFVTGASGFVGSHVAKLLLDEGYQVRAAARGDKAKHIRENSGAFGGKLEVVEIKNIISDDLSEALKGVDAVLHIASPLPGNLGPKETIDVAIDGTLNVIKQAEKAGIKRIVVTGSVAAVVNDKFTFGNSDWNPITKEAAIASGSDSDAYCASKKYAELAVWEFADAHPDIDITTILPPFVFGPILREFFSSASKPDFISNSVLYDLLKPDGDYPPFPFYIDVRDVAKAHVLALKAPAESVVGRKRLIIGSPHGLVFKEVLEIIAEKRPELKSRLITKEPVTFPSGIMPCDLDRVAEVLGLKREDFLPFEKTLLDTVDDYLELEKHWTK